MAILVFKPLRVIAQCASNAAARCARRLANWLRKPVAADKPNPSAAEPHWLPFD